LPCGEGMPRKDENRKRCPTKTTPHNEEKTFHCPAVKVEMGTRGPKGRSRRKGGGRKERTSAGHQKLNLKCVQDGIKQKVGDPKNGDLLMRKVFGL